MGMTPSCPRCAAEIFEADDSVRCPHHGEIDPLWKWGEVGYDAFAELVQRVGSMPTYLPWPMSPGWSIADFGYVGKGADADATVTTTVGSSDLDGAVEVTVVAEEPGIGLGTRCAGVQYVDPGDQIGSGPHAVHVRAGGREVKMWLVDTEDPELFAKTVFAGEADGRWLWLIVRPASAALLLRDEWLFADVTGFGPQALEMPFGGPRPIW